MKSFFPGILVGCLIATVGYAFFVKAQSHNLTSGSQLRVTKLKLAHTLDPSHPVHAAIVHMKERLDELSGGSVELDIYPSGVIGSEPQCIEQLQNGVLAMTKTSSAAMEGFTPDMGVFGLPYAFRDSDHFWKVLDGDLGKELLMQGDKKNLRGLCYFDAGSRNFYTTEKQIKTPDDLKGQKIRVQASKIAIDMIKALGGSPTPISFGELYTSLQQGVVDGAENNPPSYYSNRHHEVCKYFTLDGHTRIPDVLLISSKVWQKLTPQIQQWITQASQDASQFQRELWKKKTEEALKKAGEEGVEIFTPDQKAFVEKVQPMLESYKGTSIGKLLDRIRAVE